MSYSLNYTMHISRKHAVKARNTYVAPFTWRPPGRALQSSEVAVDRQGPMVACCSANEQLDTQTHHRPNQPH